jgi:hypothetical protein
MVPPSADDVRALISDSRPQVPASAGRLIAVARMEPADLVQAVTIPDLVLDVADEFGPPSER